MVPCVSFKFEVTMIKIKGIFLRWWILFGSINQFNVTRKYYISHSCHFVSFDNGFFLSMIAVDAMHRPKENMKLPCCEHNNNISDNPFSKTSRFPLNMKWKISMWIKNWTESQFVYKATVEIYWAYWEPNRFELKSHKKPREKFIKASEHCRNGKQWKACSRKVHINIFFSCFHVATRLLPNLFLTRTTLLFL